MIVIARFLSPADAELARSSLAAHGIAAHVDGQHLAGMIGYAGGPGEVRLLVPRRDHAAARRILGAPSTADEAPPSDPEDEAALRQGVRREKRRWRILVLGMVGIVVVGQLATLIGILIYRFR